MKTCNVVVECHDLNQKSTSIVRGIQHGGLSQRDNQVGQQLRNDRGQHGGGPARSSADACTPRQELEPANRSHSEFEGGVSSLLWGRKYLRYICNG